MAELSEGLSLGARFRLVAILGKGGMGEVWRATDTQGDNDAALKILNAELAQQQGYVDLLHAECETARGLVHPNIVRVFAVHHEAGCHFMSMEYIDGDSLNRLRGQHWHTIIQTVLPLTDALEYAHRSGIVHRDIKPSNVLLDRRGNPHLMDFGVASVLAGGAIDQVMTGGSLPSMSPQQVAGDPPGISDDIYSFGAMLFDLISGAPLFTPDISEEKVRQVKPPPLSSVSKGSGIPEQLERLVAAMLDKQPERRPAGMSAVRVVLDELLADNPVTEGDTDSTGEVGIRPVIRKSRKTEAAQEFRVRSPGSAAKQSTPNKLIFGGLGGLAVLLLVVIFILPGIVQNSANNSSTAMTEEDISRREPVASTQTEEVQVDQGSRELADQALADVLELDDRLRAIGVEAWGGADWAAARTVISEADEDYKSRLYGAATDAYRRGFLLMQPLEARAADVLASALADGQTALDDGNQLLALERFDLALLVDSNNKTATLGRERAMQLDKVLALMDQASQLELENKLADALNAYEAAFSIDSQWAAAADGRDRMRAAIAGNDYQSAMSAGYAALANRDYSSARRSFAGALRARPGDAGAQAALAQLDEEQRLANILRLSAEAEQFAQNERWADAIDRFERVLQIDRTVVPAASGLEKSRKRLELDNKMRVALASPDRLADDVAWQATGELLRYAQGVNQPGPVLTGQIKDLERLLQRAQVPVVVHLESDNETDVVIYKVGKLGKFATRNIELKPGTYTAVGVRSGYRDVRRNFRVAPEAETLSIQIRCEDPI